ncbi:MAG: phytoene desaturase family protein, partial [Mycetocola sp.]
MARVVVIGAGAAGLATAALLARDGHEVRILEQHGRPGGRAGSIEDGGFRFDTGPSWYLMPGVYEHFAHLLGTTVDELFDLELLNPGYQLWRGSEDDDASGVDRWSVPLGVDAVAADAEAMSPGDGAAIRDYLESAERAIDISLEAFLYNPFTRLRSLLSPRVLKQAPQLARWLSESLADFAAERVTGEALRQALQYPAIFLGVDPRRAPAIYHLMSRVDLVEGVQYPRGGFAAVMDSFAEQA